MGNTVSVIFFFFMANNSLVFGRMSFIWCLLAQLTFFGLSELVPIISFVYVSHKFVEIAHPELFERRVAEENQA